MIGAGVSEQVAVSDIHLDKNNPRIKKFIEMYGEDPTPEQIFQALGAGGDDEGGASGTTFDKLKNSILTNGGVIQPVILNRHQDGTLVCIDGNTRVALYKSFVTDHVPGNWSTIPALVHNNLSEGEIDAIRLQVHLVGPRAWDPYSKAKYLHYLRTQEHLPFAMIVDFCGGRQKDLAESINAYPTHRSITNSAGRPNGTYTIAFCRNRRPMEAACVRDMPNARRLDSGGHSPILPRPSPAK
jgi:hypothetical protein